LQLVVQMILSKEVAHFVRMSWVHLNATDKDIYL